MSERVSGAEWVSGWVVGWARRLDGDPSSGIRSGARGAAPRRARARSVGPKFSSFSQAAADRKRKRGRRKYFTTRRGSVCLFVCSARAHAAAREPGRGPQPTNQTNQPTNQPTNANAFGLIWLRPGLGRGALRGAAPPPIIITLKRFYPKSNRYPAAGLVVARRGSIDGVPEVTVRGPRARSLVCGQTTRTGAAEGWWVGRGAHA